MNYVLILDETNHRIKFKSLQEMFDFADCFDYNGSLTYEVYC